MRIFEKNIINLYGKQGKKWLDSLPIIIKKLCQHWHLTDINPVNNMQWNYVAFALQKNNLGVVLKISLEKQLMQNEYHALRHFDGHGAIKVLANNWTYHAMLLQQATPGHTLHQFYLYHPTDTISIYAHVVQSLARQKISSNNSVHVSSWCKAIDRISDPCIDPHLVNQAQQLKEKLLNSAQDEYLCHGDLHLENIIQHASNWLVIDPKGIIGEMAFEAAAFDILNPAEIKKNSALTLTILDRVTSLAMALNLDFNRLLAWIFLRTIISAQWFIEDKDNPSNNITLAKQIYPLLKS